MDKDTLTVALADLSGDLTAPQDKLEELRLARAAIARAIAGGQNQALAQPRLLGRPPTAAPDKASTLYTELEPIARIALEAVPPGAAPSVFVYRREFPIPTTLTALSLPAWASGRAISASFGPFHDAVGREVWIDFFEPASFIAFVRAGSSLPFLLVQARGLTPFTANKIDLSEGSIWIAAATLAPGAPAGGYTGLRISSGTLLLGQTFAVQATVSIPTGVTLRLHAKLAASTKPSGGTGPGGDARAADVQTPDSVTFVFEPTRTVLSEVGQAKLDVFGTGFPLVRSNEASFYESDIDRVAVPFTCSVTRLTIGSGRSSLWSPAGTAPVSSAAWSLPVTTASASNLGEAAGAGGLRLRLQGGITAQWQGQNTSADLGKCYLLADPGALVIGAPDARLSAVSQRISLWSDDSRGTLELTFSRPFSWSSLSAAQGFEAIIVKTPARALLDRPLTVNGDRLSLVCPTAEIGLLQKTSGATLVFAAALQTPSPDNPVALAICNALIKSSPARAILLAGEYVEGMVTHGRLALASELYYLLPILPDPYAANLSLPLGRLREPVNLGPLLTLLTWQAQTKPVVDFVLPPNAGMLTFPLPPSSQGSSASAASASLLSTADRFAVAAGHAADDLRHLTELAADFDKTVGARPGDLVLLDVSSNASLFGVQFAATARPGTTALAPGVGGGVVIANMFLESHANNVRVITLPEVQWEPLIVREQLPPPSPAFPTPMTFANDGGSSVLGAQSVELVRVAPRPALQFLVEGYQRKDNPLTVAARFTLPFGIVAFSRLHRTEVKSQFITGSPSISFVRPNFPARSLSSADQVRLAAAPSLPQLANQPSPGLPGAAVQLYNGLHHGIPTGESAITPIDDTFNSNFAPGKTMPLVPVTQIDISGYGENLFSEWRNPSDAAAIISKAQFNVLVGRTSFEVVQAFSVLYPYAVRVVRTITIERENSAEMVRHDSGWQAVSDGEYVYPNPRFGLPLVTHPGVVRAARRVTNIRDTGQRYTTSDSCELMAVRFDCDLDMEGVVLGGSADGVPSRDQLGFVQLTDPINRGVLTAGSYADLVQAFAPMGGSVDCVIDIGGSGQRMRIARVGVSATSAMGGPEFVMAAWGSPLLPAGGQWSFVRQAPAGDVPQPVDPNLGVPLVRAGAAPTPPPPSNPYRFADPEDLADPDTPASDYGLLHASGTQRVLFPRPKIDSGANFISSTVIPLIADPYALVGSVGLFPRPTDCIPFPSASYALQIGPNQSLRLSPSPLSFTVSRPARTIADASSVSAYVVYADDKANPSRATLAIDSAASVPWSFSLERISLATSAGSLGEVMRLVGDLKSDATSPPTISSARMVFGGALSLVQDVITLLRDLGFSEPLSVSMSNQAKVIAGMKLPITGAPPEPHAIDIGIGQITSAYIEASAVLVHPAQGYAETLLTASALLLLRTPWPPLMAAGLFYVSLDLSVKNGRTLTAKIGAGFAVDALDVGSFKLQAYVVLTQFFIDGDTVEGYGCGLLIKATLSLKIVSAYVSVEGKMALLDVKCSNGEAVWGVAKLTLAVDVTIAWTVDINISYSWQITQNFNDGPCSLPSVV